MGKESCRQESINITMSDADGLIGSSEWLEIVVPIPVTVLPCLTKILLKLIEKYGSTKVTCGDITVENVSQKDVSMILNKRCALQDKMDIIERDVIAGKKIYGKPLDIPSLRFLYNELLKNLL